ncbi:MAG: DUF4910 domain-containing protein [Candidatus Hodarchaeota archaeon]
MDVEKYLNKILSEVNGQRAWDWVAKISQFSRIQGSKGYHEIAQIIKNELSRIGYSEIEHFKSPADGKNNVWGYVAAYQWEIESGELWITEPEKIKLCDYNEIKTSVITHSKACDIITEVVDIGKGDKKEDYESKDINGKIILISSPTYRYHSYIEDSGALGVIYYPDMKRTGDQLDKRIYNSFFTTHDRLDKAKSGFSISYKQAIYLKELLAKGAVKVHALINAKFMEGNLEVVTSSIKGTKYPDQEIVVIAHLCHPFPSANDNASGAAGLLELARALKNLIDKKIINPPKRTIRFVWVPEFNGTVPWMKQHENKISNVLACLNLDMIGEHPLKIGYPLLINLAAHSTPSILNDIATFFIEKIVDHPKGIAINGTKVPMSYRFTGFEGGSDHVLFADSYFGIPSLMFGHEDPYYHSSMDTVEYCDSTELKRVIGMGTSISHTLSLLDDNLISELWPIIQQGVYNRWGKAIKLLEELILSITGLKYTSSKEDLIEIVILGTDIIQSFLDYELNLLNWLEKFDSSYKLVGLLDFSKKLISEILEIYNLRWSNQIKEYIGDNKVEDLKTRLNVSYMPNFNGPLDIEKLFPLFDFPPFKDFCKSLKSEYLGPINELINLLCKGYKLLRVASYLSLEYNTTILPKKVVELVNYLEKENIIYKN